MSFNTRIATLIRYPTGYLIHPNDRLTSGIWRAKPIAIHMSNDSSPETLFKAILDTLIESRSNIPDAANPSEVSKAFFKAIGMKSNKNYMADALLVEIAEKENSYAITPYKNGGWKGPDRGFRAIIEREETLSKATSAQEFMTCIFRKLKECE